MAIPRLPPEISQYIIDILHNAPRTLKQCCLVSKSWVPRAWKHIFGQIYFNCSADLEAWKRAFPDPANSPACYTRLLSIDCVEVVTAADAEEGGWIRAFSKVVRRLEVWSDDSTVSQIFALISHLPLLEDLVLAGTMLDEGDDHAIFQPSTSPPLTGTLVLSLSSGIEQVVPQLLSLPNGIRLWELEYTFHSKQDLRQMMALVEECSNILEHVDIDDETHEDSWADSIIDLSKATKLKRLTFWTYNSVAWVIMALETISIDHRSLREVSIHTFLLLPSIDFVSDQDFNLRETIGEEMYRGWKNLDHILVQLSELHAVCVNVTHYPGVGRSQDLRMCMMELLPGTTKRDGTELHFDE